MFILWFLTQYYIINIIVQTVPPRPLGAPVKQNQGEFKSKLSGTSRNRPMMKRIENEQLFRNRF